MTSRGPYEKYIHTIKIILYRTYSLEMNAWEYNIHKFKSLPGLYNAASRNNLKIC